MRWNQEIVGIQMEADVISDKLLASGRTAVAGWPMMMGAIVAGRFLP